MRIGVASSRDARTGRAIARPFGTSSPKTIWVPVARARASPRETPTVAPGGMRSVASRSGRRALAIVGSATNPRISEVRVMPSWAPERWKERRRSNRTATLAGRFPSRANCSMRLRSQATRANSAATKRALAAISRSAAPMPRAICMDRFGRYQRRDDTIGLPPF